MKVRALILDQLREPAPVINGDVHLIDADGNDLGNVHAQIDKQTTDLWNECVLKRVFEYKFF